MALDTVVEDAIRSNKGFVVIMAGSDSDAEHINKLSKELTKYQLPHQVRICSAHKEPGELTHIIKEYNAVPGALAYIAVAGGTDALSGTLSFNVPKPVISCPPDAPNESCLTNPPGSSNAYIARPANAARFCAQLFSDLPGTPYKELLTQEAEKKVVGLRNADGIFSVFPYKPVEVKK